MLDFEKFDFESLDTILDKVQKVHRFFKRLREIAEESKKTQVPSFLSSEEAATILGISDSYLGVLRHRGQGPNFRKIGQFVFYDVSDLLDYIDSCRCTSTLDQKPIA